MNTVLSAALVVAAAVAGTVLAQQGEKKRFAYPQPANQQEAMERWQRTWNLGPPHERLHEMLGSYEMSVRMWMEGPDGKPMESKGSAEIGWLFEGRWLKFDWSTVMMGMNTKGCTVLGYDNFKERYVASSVDNMQTCMNSSSGLFDKNGDNLILWGTIDEPMTPEQDKQVKYVYRGFGKDTFTLEVHDMMIGETNTKVMEFSFTRRTK